MENGRATTVEEAREYAGFRYARIDKRTGGLVIVVDGDAQGLDTEDGNRWYTLCETHNRLCAHRTLALAKAHAADPAGWCEECDREAQEYEAWYRTTDAYREG